MKLIGIFILFSFLCPDAKACQNVAPEQITSYQELIARTENIVLAEVEDIDELKSPNTKARRQVIPYPVPSRTVAIRYKFKVVEELKGKLNRLSFEIEGQPLAGTEENFNLHQDPSFWEKASGRSKTTKDCEINPSFVTNKKYLIFLNKPYHRKSFERIDDSKDKWLQTVRELAGNK